MSDYDRNWIFFVLFCIGFAAGALIRGHIDRDTECELRFELAEIPTDSLAVIRGHPYCRVAP